MKPDDAEDMFLACVMQAPNYLEHSLVGDEHLSERARRVSNAIRKLVGEGWPQVTPALVEQRVGSQAMRTLAARYDIIVGVESIREAERALLDAWIDGELSKALKRSSARVLEVGREMAISELQARQRELATYDGRNNWSMPHEIASKWLDDEQRKLNGEGPPIIESGFADIDVGLRYFQPEMMTALAGYTNDGKSTITLQLLTGMALRGTPVAMISLEDSKTIPVKRQLTLVMEDEAIAQAIADNMLQQHQIADLRRVVSEEFYRTMPFHLEYGPGWSVDRICNAMQDAVRRFGCKVVAVDYLQCLDSEGKDRRVFLGNACKRIKAAAAEVGAHVILVSQLVRPEGKSRAQRPNLFMLKETGDLENTADYVGIVWRPERGNDKAHEQASFIVAKAKDGHAHDVGLYWSTTRNCYTSMIPQL